MQSGQCSVVSTHVNELLQLSWLCTALLVPSAEPSPQTVWCENPQPPLSGHRFPVLPSVSQLFGAFCGLSCPLHLQILSNFHVLIFNFY